MSDIVAVSGGFDPIKREHIRLILAAAEYGEVLIILNSDEWLLNKNGYVYMKWDERAEILGALKGVSMVVPVNDSDGTVCKALKRAHIDYFANGGDREYNNTPEVMMCNKLGIKMLWNVG